jgi:hypothetical protein
VTFSAFLDRYPPETYIRKNCLAELSSPVHAHIDMYGNYLTGFCSGLRVGQGTAFELERLYSEAIAIEEHPILEMLVHGTLGDLLSHAHSIGFRPDPKGYISPCHLCGHIRTWLFHHIPPASRPQELAPSFFYEEMERLFCL